jgi:UDP-N-acetylmuramyl pentapeptide synthase
MDRMADDFPYDVLVQEVAEDDLELMLPFMRLIKPKVCVVTGVSLAHTARMQSAS